MNEQTIVVKYKVQKQYCSCCNQKLPEVQTSKVREFTFSKEVAMSWAPWDEISEYREDMETMVPEFVHETIQFFATDSFEKIIIDDSEIEQVRAFILSKVVSQYATPEPTEEDTP